MTPTSSVEVQRSDCVALEVTVTMGDPRRALLSVIIPTYNRQRLLRETLDSLVRQRFPAGRFEVIVADDGSSDATRQVVSAYQDQLRIGYHFQPDLGFRAGTARNAGARLAAGKILVFLDTGAVVGPDFLHRHWLTHQRRERQSVLGYVYGLNPGGTVTDLRATLDRLPPEQLPAHYRDQPEFQDVRNAALQPHDFDLNRLLVPWAMFFTVNCSLHAVDFEAIGGFDESFCGWGAEDLELGFRIHRSGLRFTFDRDAWAIHAPHERDLATNMTEFRTNVARFLAKFPEPVNEVGWAVVQHGALFDWEDGYRHLRACTERVRALPVHDALDRAASRLPTGERLAVVGPGGKLPASLPPATLFEFDRHLLDQALVDGRHTGYHSVGLRTPVPDNSFDTVLLTDRLAGLRERWDDTFLAEAHRIGKRVVNAD